MWADIENERLINPVILSNIMDGLVFLPDDLLILVEDVPLEMGLWLWV